MSAQDAAAYPPVSDQKGGARRPRRSRSASPKRRSVSPKRRSASPKRATKKGVVVRRRKSVSPSRKAKKAMAGGAKRRARSASPKRAAKKGTRYEKLTLEQLCKKAKKYGVPYSGLKKSQLIRAIRSKKGLVKKARKSAAKK